MALPAAVVGGAVALKLGGSLLGGFGAKKAAKREARQIAENARNQYGADVQTAQEARRQGRAVLSDAEANLAASGADLSDAGTIDQLARLDREFEYNKLGMLYDASLRLKGGLAQARAVKKGGKNALTASLISGGGDALGLIAGTD